MFLPSQLNRRGGGKSLLWVMQVPLNAAGLQEKPFQTLPPEIIE